VTFALRFAAFMLGWSIPGEVSHLPARLGVF
jgi:hypothetical protein